MSQIILTQVNPEKLIEAISEQVTARILTAVLSQKKCSSGKEEGCLNRKQAATYLNVTLPTLDRYRSEGRIPFYQTGRTIYFKKSEIDNALVVNHNKNGGKHV